MWCEIKVDGGGLLIISFSVGVSVSVVVLVQCNFQDRASNFAVTLLLGIREPWDDLLEFAGHVAPLLVLLLVSMTCLAEVSLQ